MNDSNSQVLLFLSTITFSLLFDLRRHYGHSPTEPRQSGADAKRLWGAEHGLVCSYNLCLAVSGEGKAADKGNQVSGSGFLEPR